MPLAIITVSPEPAPELHALVPIQPVPWKRVRRSRQGGKVHAYLDERYSAYLDELRQSWAYEHGAKRIEQGHLGIRLAFSGKGKVGDLDNYTKAVLDAGNGVLWGDDRQVKAMAASFASWGNAARPSVELWLWRL